MWQLMSGISFTSSSFFLPILTTYSGICPINILSASCPPFVPATLEKLIELDFLTNAPLLNFNLILSFIFYIIKDYLIFTFILSFESYGIPFKIPIFLTISFLEAVSDTKSTLLGGPTIFFIRISLFIGEKELLLRIYSEVNWDIFLCPECGERLSGELSPKMWSWPKTSPSIFIKGVCCIIVFRMWNLLRGVLSLLFKFSFWVIFRAKDLDLVLFKFKMSKSGFFWRPGESTTGEFSLRSSSPLPRAYELYFFLTGVNFDMVAVIYSLVIVFFKVLPSLLFV